MFEDIVLKEGCNPVHTIVVIALLLFNGSTCKLIFRIVEVQIQRTLLLKTTFENCWVALDTCTQFWYFRKPTMIYISQTNKSLIVVWFLKNTAEVYRNIRSHISQGKNSRLHLDKLDKIILRSLGCLCFKPASWRILQRAFRYINVLVMNNFDIKLMQRWHFAPLNSCDLRRNQRRECLYIRVLMADFKIWNIRFYWSDRMVEGTGLLICFGERETVPRVHQCNTDGCLGFIDREIKKWNTVSWSDSRLGVQVYWFVLGEGERYPGFIDMIQDGCFCFSDREMKKSKNIKKRYI